MWSYWVITLLPVERIEADMATLECGHYGHHRPASMLGKAYIDNGDVYFGRAYRIGQRPMKRRGLTSRMQIETPTKQEHGFPVHCPVCRKTLTISLTELRRCLKAGPDEILPDKISVGANGIYISLDPRLSYVTSS
jgi:hypothetical protein